MWSPHDGLSIPTDLLPQSWRVDRGRPHIPPYTYTYASYTQLLTSDLAVRQQFANDKLWEMLTMPLALCRWQPVNVREVMCSASPWRWHVARGVTLVTFRTSLLPILILQILIDLNHAMDVFVLMWGCLDSNLKTRRSSVLYHRQMQHLSSSGSNLLSSIVYIY